MHYCESFIADGYETLESVEDITSEELSSFITKGGHAKLFLKKLNEQKNGAPSAAFVSLPPINSPIVERKKSLRVETPRKNVSENNFKLKNSNHSYEIKKDLAEVRGGWHGCLTAVQTNISENTFTDVMLKLFPESDKEFQQENAFYDILKDKKNGPFGEKIKKYIVTRLDFSEIPVLIRGQMFHIIAFEIGKIGSLESWASDYESRSDMGEVSYFSEVQKYSNQLCEAIHLLHDMNIVQGGLFFIAFT